MFVCLETHADLIKHSKNVWMLSTQGCCTIIKPNLYWTQIIPFKGIYHRPLKELAHCFSHSVSHSFWVERTRPRLRGWSISCLKKTTINAWEITSAVRAWHPASRIWVFFLSSLICTHTNITLWGGPVPISKEIINAHTSRLADILKFESLKDFN